MNLTSPKTIQYIKGKYGFHLSKSLGQNFLCDQHILQDIVQAANLDSKAGAVEIGPGIGVLTKELSKAANRVLAIELDARLLPILDETLSDCDNVTVLNADILKLDLAETIKAHFTDFSNISVAANLPYYITTPILTRLLENYTTLFNNIVIMVQKEVAERICSAPGSKKCSALSVLVHYHSIPTLVSTVPATAFFPPPKVASAVVRLQLRQAPAVAPRSEQHFFKTVRAAFGQRRKTLINALIGASLTSMTKAELQQTIVSMGLSTSIRGEQLTIEQFCQLSDRLLEHG